MKHYLCSGVLFAALFMTGTALGTELETDAQKLGYIIGMDIGGSLKQQGADLDLDSLIDRKLIQEARPLTLEKMVVHHGEQKEWEGA